MTFFTELEKKNPKICMKPKKVPKNQSQFHVEYNTDKLYSLI